MEEYKRTACKPARRPEVIAQRIPQISESTAQRLERRRERERRKRRRMRIALIQRIVLVAGCGAVLLWCIRQPQTAYTKAESGQAILNNFAKADNKTELGEGDERTHCLFWHSRMRLFRRFIKTGKPTQKSCLHCFWAILRWASLWQTISRRKRPCRAALRRMS